MLTSSDTSLLNSLICVSYRSCEINRCSLVDFSFISICCWQNSIGTICSQNYGVAKFTFLVQPLLLFIVLNVRFCPSTDFNVSQMIKTIITCVTWNSKRIQTNFAKYFCLNWSISQTFCILNHYWYNTNQFDHFDFAFFTM
jgi:hypothetical protein